MSKTKFKNKGFTLVELLIVITIIGVISTLGMTSYLRSQKRSRDAKRMSDIGTIMKALEQMYGESYSYPSTNGNCSDIPGLAAYFPQGVPTDPLNKSAYLCEPSGVSAYCVQTQSLENVDKINCEDCEPCTDCDPDMPHFCVWSQQE